MRANELFRFIDGYPDYLVGDNGTIYSTIKRKELVQSDLNEYIIVTLIGDNGATHALVHRLVAAAFIEKVKGKEFVDHIDGNRANNVVSWNCVVLNDKDGSSFDADDISLYPIPLTLEILEKNGFKKIQIHGEKQDDIFQCYDGEITIEVGIYDPNYILIHYRYETPDGIHSGELSSIVKADGGKFYLHELQHALRLCKVEKEIEL